MLVFLGPISHSDLGSNFANFEKIRRIHFYHLQSAALYSTLYIPNFSLHQKRQSLLSKHSIELTMLDGI